MLKFNWLAPFLLLIMSFSAIAVTPTKEQIEQFKNLPKSQQEMLAQQMGIDLADLDGELNSQNDREDNNLTPNYPRGTQFDEDGKPITDLDELAEMEKELEQSTELKPFGYEIFANAPSTFSPNLDIAIPANYLVGPGDNLSIQMYGKKSASYEKRISREGFVVIPDLGPIKVAGLTFTEVKDLVSKTVKDKLIGQKAVVGLAELRSMRVFVLGDAHKPGPYIINSLSSMTHALFAAGGINDIGSMRNIVLKRSGKVVSKLDLYDLLLRGDSTNDVILHSGDVVFVEPIGATVTVDGDVRRPAIYEMAEEETFAQLLSMAGGALPSAYVKSTSVQRFNDANLKTALSIDFTDKKSANQKVKDGDEIYFLKNSEMFEQSVTILGAVTRPGRYQWYEGQKIADILPNIKSHLLHYADLNYGLVVREIDIAGNIEVHQFSIVKALANLNSKDNLQLQGSDRVMIFSRLNKANDELLSFDKLAFTQEALLEKEKSLAKEKYKEKLFWDKYGDGEEPLNTEEEDLSKLVNQSVAQITGGVLEEEIDIRELSLFSRERLLGPVIEQLKRQGASGKPIQLIEVDGHVKYPGLYPLAQQARVSDLIAAAGGVIESAYLERAEITRNVLENGMASKESISFHLGEALLSDEGNLLLQSRDRLNVHQIPAWSENHVVELRGEFVFPGKYTIRRGEKLSDLVAKAGGFTPHAHPEGSVFSREKLKELEQQNLFKLSADLRVEMVLKTITDSKASGGSHEELQKMLADLSKVTPVGRLVIDLPQVIAKNEYDIFLENGDVLYVPTMKNSINVIGQVQVTSSHIYDEGVSADTYISQSGGVKKRADIERIYVISANGSIKMLAQDNWFTGSATASLKPGDTVVVPLDSEYMNNLELWSTATGIIYNTAVAIAAISGI